MFLNLLINHATWNFDAFKMAVLKQKTDLIHLVCSTIQASVAQWANCTAQMAFMLIQGAEHWFESPWAQSPKEIFLLAVFLL